jgi:dTDP-4-amino-4,6-dideoxygalactose transaminase
MIPMNDFTAEPEALIQAQLAATERVLRSGWYVLGKEVQHFEQRWADTCGLPYAVGVANGLEALEIGLMALHLQPGDEVITTAMTAFATVLSLIRTGLTPIFADIDRHTGLLDPASVERCISPRTKAVLLVHLYGHIHQMDRWIDLCNTYNLLLVEDCAQAHLAQWQGRYGGSFGEWGAYSFYPTKNLGAIGDAGAIVTHQESIAQQAKILRNYGQIERYYHPEIGLNSRLDELQAALLDVRLNWLETFIKHRKATAQTYYQNITNPAIQLLDSPTDPDNHSYHLFVLLTQHRDLLSQYLKEHEIATLIHYPSPLHQQKPCLSMRSDPKGLGHTEHHAQHCLSIPCHPQLRVNQIDHIIEVINEFKP